MNPKKLIILGLVAAIGICFARLIGGHPPLEDSVASNPATPLSTPAAPIIAAPASSSAPAIDPSTPADPAPGNAGQVVAKNLNAPGQIVPPAKAKAPLQDPDARAALSLVGADPAAEQYWASAINNPDLPAGERKDLIEDLNEDGLSDPHHPGPQDMPLIWNRIQIIEELAPNAMDQVNADAFAEAYKDLVNLASGKSAD